MPVRVNVLAMGPLPRRALLDTVVERGNGVQQHYAFAISEPLTSLGPPNDKGEYRFKSLAEKLLQRKRGSGSDSTADILVGVVDSPLYDELFSGIDESLRVVIVSTANMLDTLERTQRSHADYVLVEIAAQLLAIEYRSNKNC